MDLNSLASLLLRLGISTSMMTHGWPKFLKVINGDFAFADPIGLGPTVSLILTALAEFICGFFLIAGFKTRLAAIPPMVTMLVAIFIIHWDDPWKKIEFPLLYLIAYLTIFLLGSGRYSVDARLKMR